MFEIVANLGRIANALERIAAALETAPKRELTEAVRDALSHPQTERGRAFQ